MDWKSLDDIDLAGKTALTRVDLNVPVENGRVTDTTRIDRIVPTIKDILDRGARVVLLAHFGRPKGKRVEEMSLRQVVPALSAALGRDVAFAEDCIGGPAKKAVNELPPDGVLVLENTRFHAGEEANDPVFAASLAALGNVYVNDAFSAAHRAHGSTEGIARLMPSAAGRLMEAELKALEAALGTPTRPVMAIVGGAKVSTKIDLLANLAGKVDHLVIGGGMANTFLAAEGIDVGKSLAEHDMAQTVKDIRAKAEEAGCQIVLPEDAVVARAFEAGAPSETVASDACPSDAMILDVGPKSVERITALMETCATLVWNGPLGAFEIAPFDAGTLAAAKKAGALTAEGRLVSVAGGGDTVAALNKAGVTADFSYVSTAGGAFLEWMEGKTLPGVAALKS